jgi:signal transduction histidine kinase
MNHSVSPREPGPSGGGTRRRRGPALAARLLAAQTLVLVGGATTAWLVATAIGPGIFHDHLARAGVGHTPAEAAHVEDAFASALLVALGVALLTAVLMALAVTAYFSRRVQRSIAAVAESAARIEEGQYTFRVGSPGLGAEFDLLADTTNALAHRLGDIERTRQRLLADLAHEMRTPLASIEAHLEAIEDGVRDLDPETLEILRGGTQRLHRLAEDITAVSRVEESHSEPRLERTRPGEVLQAAAAQALDGYRAKGVTVSVEASETAEVLVDQERLSQVLANLLENALRHSAPGGSVRLAAVQSDDRWVELSVTDTGEGIAPEHLPHIFERFYQADPARRRTADGSGLGGSGIGLTISKALVEAQGGRLWASSDGPGLGATFTIRMPVADR